MTLKLAILGIFCLIAMTTAARAANPIVVIETSKGTIEAELFEDKAPVTVKNFLGYVNDKHYDGLIFHRIIETFMIQGGGMDKDMKPKATKDPIKNESTNGLPNIRGTLAMARTSDPNSATSQFFINTVDNAFLDKKNAQDKVGYCVFGRVVKGMDVVDAIKKVPTGRQDVPKEPVVIKSITVKK